MTEEKRPESRYCGAKRRRDGQPCERPSGWGTTHPGIGSCKLHGGSMPNHVTHAQNIRAEQAVRSFGLPVDIDAHQALRDEIHRTAGAVQWLGEIVADLDQERIVLGLTSVVTGSGTGQRANDTTQRTIEAKTNVWVQLWQQERRHLVDVCRVAITCGLAEREVDLAEQHGRLMAGIFRAVFDDPEAALDDDTRKRLRRVTSRHLRALPSPTDVGEGETA